MDADDDEFWDDLLAHIRQRILVPVIGPEITVVDGDTPEQTLTKLIGQRLAVKYDLPESAEIRTMDQAVSELLMKRDQHGIRLYQVINEIVRKLDPAPGDALRNLAAIDDLRLFLTTTPDRLLAQAVNEVRYPGGRRGLYEIVFSPNQSTSEQPQDAQSPAETDTVVVSLFGQATSIPQYAIHEEDRLEWLHALLSNQASLPGWLSSQLKQQPMLFVGCEIPDWIGRFLLRMSSSTRLWDERKQFFIVGSPTSHEPTLSRFFDIYFRNTRVHRLQMAPTEFAAELRARWEEDSPTRPSGAARVPGLSAPAESTIFISYMREDLDAARRLSNAIDDIAGEGAAWLDDLRIQPGAEWREEILTAIRRKIRLFVAVISANTERKDEGYVFREWKTAVDRSHEILGRKFIVPVVVDEAFRPKTYERIPPDFTTYDFGHAPAGQPDARLLAMLQHEIRAMRRKDEGQHVQLRPPA